MRLDGSVTLADFYASASDVVQKGLESNTSESYSRAWRKRVIPSLGRLPLSEISDWPKIRVQIAVLPDGYELRFHDLRHTFLSRLARIGVAPATIQSVAGHASITTTERYTHTSSTEAALKVRDLINGANREVANGGGDGAANTSTTRPFVL